MQVSKLKTIAIILLCIINLSFLSVIAYNYSQEKGMQRKINENLCELASRNGIELKADDIPENLSLPILLISRDYEVERALASQFLGEVEFTDQGGDISFYQSENGYMRFRSNGNFELFFEEAVFSQEKLKQLLSTLETGLMLTSESPEELDYTCVFDSVPAVNCTLSFHYQYIALRSGSGRLPMNVTRDTAVFLNRETAFVKFINSLEVGGDICSRIDSWRASYLYIVSDEPRLVPCWQIVTDTAQYCITATDYEIIKLD